MRRKRKPLSGGAKAALIIIIVLMIGIIGFSAYKLLGIANSYKQAADVYSNIQGLIENVDLSDEEDVADFELLDNGNAKKKNLSAVEFGRAWKRIFARLKEKYPDLVGYIQQEGVISYPILQAEDNNKYLRNMINGDYNVAGSIFVDCTFDECLDGPYAIIYGHDMNDDSMFGSLKKYEKEDYYKEHPEFDLYIGEKHYKYYVFSSFVADAYGEVYTYRYNEGAPDAEQEFLEFAQRMRDACDYETDVPELTKDSKIVCLSTCVPWKDYSLRRVVFLVRGEEVIPEATSAEKTDSKKTNTTEEQQKETKEEQRD